MSCHCSACRCTRGGGGPHANKARCECLRRASISPRSVCHGPTVWTRCPVLQRTSSTCCPPRTGFPSLTVTDSQMPLFQRNGRRCASIDFFTRRQVGAGTWSTAIAAVCSQDPLFWAGSRTRALLYLPSAPVQSPQKRGKRFNGRLLLMATFNAVPSIAHNSLNAIGLHLRATSLLLFPLHSEVEAPTLTARGPRRGPLGGSTEPTQSASSPMPPIDQTFGRFPFGSCRGRMSKQERGAIDGEIQGFPAGESCLGGRHCDPSSDNLRERPRGISSQLSGRPPAFSAKRRVREAWPRALP